MTEDNTTKNEVVDSAQTESKVQENIIETSLETEEMTSLHERTIAALSYIGFFAIVPFYLKKDSKFCRFHGKQGMLIAIIFFFAKLLIVVDVINDLFLILQFGIFVYMGMQAISGKWKKLPLVYEKSCELENMLSLKTKEEEEELFKPDEVDLNTKNQENK